MSQMLATTPVLRLPDTTARPNPPSSPSPTYIPSNPSEVSYPPYSPTPSSIDANAARPQRIARWTQEVPAGQVSPSMGVSAGVGSAAWSDDVKTEHAQSEELFLKRQSKRLSVPLPPQLPPPTRPLPPPPSCLRVPSSPTGPVRPPPMAYLAASPSAHMHSEYTLPRSDHLLYPVPGFKPLVPSPRSERSEREAYLTSALQFPLEMIAELAPPSFLQSESRPSSPSKSGRVGSFLSRARSTVSLRSAEVEAEKERSKPDLPLFLKVADGPGPGMIPTRRSSHAGAISHHVSADPLVPNRAGRRGRSASAGSAPIHPGQLMTRNSSLHQHYQQSTPEGFPVGPKAPVVVVSAPAPRGVPVFSQQAPGLQAAPVQAPHPAAPPGPPRAQAVERTSLPYAAVLTPHPPAPVLTLASVPTAPVTVSEPSDPMNDPFARAPHPALAHSERIPTRPGRGPGLHPRASPQREQHARQPSVPNHSLASTESGIESLDSSRRGGLLKVTMSWLNNKNRDTPAHPPPDQRSLNSKNSGSKLSDSEGSNDSTGSVLSSERDKTPRKPRSVSQPVLNNNAQTKRHSFFSHLPHASSSSSDQRNVSEPIRAAPRGLPTPSPPHDKGKRQVTKQMSWSHKHTVPPLSPPASPRISQSVEHLPARKHKWLHKVWPFSRSNSPSPPRDTHGRTSKQEGTLRRSRSHTPPRRFFHREKRSSVVRDVHTSMSVIGNASQMGDTLMPKEATPDDAGPIETVIPEPENKNHPSVGK